METITMDRQKILIVEDHAAARNMLEKLLIRRGNEVFTASDGEEGLVVARQERPSLIITDLLMPHMDGYEFVRQLRADPSTALIKVVYYTGNYNASEARSLATACGVSCVMDKSADAEEILHIIDETLGTHFPSPLIPISTGFEKEHLRVVTDKLSEKVNELENLNMELEKRVARRTRELASANARLVELNRLKDEFLTIVSHDLRSPLSGIVLGAEAMIANSDSMDSGRRTELLKQIVACAAEQINFVNDLLALARNEEGGEKLYLSILRLSEVATEAIEAVAMQAEAKGIRLELSTSKPEPAVSGDRKRLLQLFSNLLTNGIKFTPIGGRIQMHITGHDRDVCLKISDTGIGIPGDRLPEVFERFNTAHATGTEGETGTGLGLAIARQIVELHGGTIAIESAVGIGTTVFVKLPVADPVSL